jgi:hypothetical protein
LPLICQVPLALLPPRFVGRRRHSDAKSKGNRLDARVQQVRAGTGRLGSLTLALSAAREEVEQLVWRLAISGIRSSGINRKMRSDTRAIREPVSRSPSCCLWREMHPSLDAWDNRMSRSQHEATTQNRPLVAIWRQSLHVDTPRRSKRITRG